MKVLVAIVMLGWPVAMAVSQGVQAPPAAQLRTETNVVVVPALVSTAGGQPVFTLTAADFKITDNGVEQKLTLDEETGGEPLALVVAVETGGGGARKLGSYGNLSALLGAVVGAVPHRIAVVSFDGAPTLVEDFTPDVDAAAGTIHDLQPGDKGAAILDGLKFSVDLLRKQPASWRRAILLISETNDRSSQTGMDDALRAISDTNTAIYSLAFSTGKSEAGHYGARELPFSKGESGIKLENGRPNPPHGCMGDDPEDPDEARNKAVRAYDCMTQLAPPLALAKMAAIAMTDGLQRNVPETVAEVTGGEYFKFEDARGLERDLVEISNHVPNRYMLSFHPESPRGGYHVVALSLRDRPGLRVRARTGYWVDGAQ
ncbi:MAG: VWA domain-containing protein [Terracidiphilus sp.]|jgi:VWFA-related protein